jgi:hypothetical protein
MVDLMKKVAILQSNYIPWKGYFDIMSKVDVFVFYDDVQYTKGDWRNRNKIKTPNGIKWLTIPCGINNKRLICEVELEDSSWQKSHWAFIENSYRKAPYFEQYQDFFKSYFLDKTWTNLSEFNQTMIKGIARELLGIETRFDDSRNYNLNGKSADRVLDLLEKTEAEIYISGPAAKAYLEPEAFSERNMELKYMDYSSYEEYPQLYPPFEHGVSIIDLIFNVGPEARDFCFS